jgi:hypothetical protein
MPKRIWSTLDYAPTPPWHRRRRGVRLLRFVIALVVIASMVLTVPIYRRYEAARLTRKVLEIRRQEIARRFDENILMAGRAATAGNIDNARLYLLDAEVCRDADTAIFTSKEINEFDQRMMKVSRQISAITKEPSEPKPVIRR